MGRINIGVPQLEEIKLLCSPAVQQQILVYLFPHDRKVGWRGYCLLESFGLYAGYHQEVAFNWSIPVVTGVNTIKNSSAS